MKQYRRNGTLPYGIQQVRCISYNYCAIVQIRQIFYRITYSSLHSAYLRKIPSQARLNTNHPRTCSPEPQVSHRLVHLNICHPTLVRPSTSHLMLVSLYTSHHRLFYLNTSHPMQVRPPEHQPPQTISPEQQQPKALSSIWIRATKKNQKRNNYHRWKIEGKEVVWPLYINTRKVKGRLMQMII